MRPDSDEIRELEEFIDALTKGRMDAVLPDSSEFPEELRGLVDSLRVLADNVRETYIFTGDIAKGNLDADPPGRKNYFAAPIKELHSQLSSFAWSMRQFLGGNMVSKLFYPGELFESYNTLIDKVSQTLSTISEGEQPEWGNKKITSWRYHQLLSAINQIHIMILEVGPDGSIIFGNPPARKLFDGLERLPYGQLPEQAEPLMRYLCTFSEVAERLSAASLLTSDFPVLRELYNSTDGTWYKVATDCVQLTDGHYGLLHVIDDISEWKRNEIDLKMNAAIDPLTGAYTRKEGLKKLDELIANRDRQPSCVAFADIDGLKSINDEFGHVEGDFAIKSIIDVVMTCMRNTDCVVRYGGDEFLILFVGCTLPVAQKVLERIRLKLDSINADMNKGYTLEFSVGLAEIGEETTSAAEIIQTVDQLMYLDKSQRKKERRK